MEKQELNIRGLQAGDLFKAAKVIGKVSDGVLRKIKANGYVMNNPEDPNNLDGMSLGLIIFEVALTDAETELKTLLAGLILKENGKPYTAAEFDQMPLDTPLTVIETLAANEDLTAFFTRASIVARTFIGKK